MLEGMSQGAASDFIVAGMISEFAELVQDEVARILGHLVACVVDFLHIALGASGANDVRRICHPLVEPIKTFL